MKELKGFTKVMLRPGETRRVSVALDARSFSFYDAEAKRWRAESGDYGMLEGRSSEEALRRACIAGALAASRFGAQTSLPTADEVDALL